MAWCIVSGVAPDPRVLALCMYANGTWWALEDDDPAVERQAALAEVARAAREVLDYENIPSRKSLSALRTALARLDKDTT